MANSNNIVNFYFQPINPADHGWKNWGEFVAYQRQVEAREKRVPLSFKKPNTETFPLYEGERKSKYIWFKEGYYYYVTSTLDNLQLCKVKTLAELGEYLEWRQLHLVPTKPIDDQMLIDIFGE